MSTHDGPPEWEEMSEDEPASSSQSASDSSAASQASSSGTQQARSKPPKQRLADIIGFLLLALIMVALAFYFLDLNPIRPKQVARRSSASALAILGEYNSEVYIFKGKQKNIYAYNPTNKLERKICEFAGLDAAYWHPSGRVILLSFAYNPKGGLYLLDLTRQPPAPEPELMTNREADPYFPAHLSLESGLPLVWGSKGEQFAFVAWDKQKNTQSLFVYTLSDKKLHKTDAKDFQRIANLVWIKDDAELIFTVANNGQEKIYRVNKTGGDFRTWDAQP